MDPLRDFGAAEITVVPGPGNAPEAVVVDGEGRIWTGVEPPVEEMRKAARAD